MNAPHPGTRAGVYLWSMDGSEVVADLDRQRVVVAAFAAPRQIACVAEFEDRASGLADGFVARPGLQALIAAIGNGQVDLAIVERAACLPVEPLQRELILHELRRAGVACLIADSGEDLALAAPGDGETQRIRDVLAAAAEFGADTGVVALRRSRPHGDPTARALAEIQRMQERRLNLVSIARYLNAMGLRDPDGAQWTRSSVFAFARGRLPS